MSGHLHSAIFLLCGTRNSAQPNEAARMGGEFVGRVDTCKHLAKALEFI